jgi:arsenate reductase (thioredoxin)
MNESIKQRTVLFLCTGNSCRSQMAEAIVNHFLGEQWKAVSAGTEPAGYVHPMALQVLAEMGIHHQGLSKSVEVFWNEPLDLVITVCDGAAENCPVWLGKGKRTHIGFIDPAHAPGSDSEKLVVFRQVRDEIKNQILPFLKQFVEG